MRGFFLTLAVMGITSLASAQPPETAPLVPTAPTPTVPVEVISLEPMTPGARYWFSAEYLMWWTKGGSFNYPQQLAVNQTTTAISGGGPTIFTSATAINGIPGGDFNMGYRNGGRFNFGFWLNNESTIGVEGSYFFLTWDDAGTSQYTQLPPNMILLPPDNEEGPPVPAILDQINVFQQVVITNRLQGSDVHALLNLTATPRWRVDALAGYRWFNFTERMDASVSSIDLPGPTNPGFTILSLAAPTSFTDTVLARTNFYGAQVGLRGSGSFGRFTLQLDKKISLGGVRETVSLSTTNNFSAAGPQVGPGSLFVTPGNIGDYTKTRFALAGEVDATLAFRVTDRFLLSLGYSFLYLEHVARAGNQVDTSNSGLASLADPNRTFPVILQDSSFWAQGINFGLMLRY